MKTVQIKCDTNDYVNIDDNAKTNGISITLVDEKQAPVAKYEFDGRKLSNLTQLLYYANNVRIHFYGDITPTMMFEISSSNG